MKYFKYIWALLLFYPLVGYSVHDIKIAPIHVKLPTEKPVSSLTLENQGSEPDLLQIQTMHWSQHDGENGYTPTQDLIVVPMIFTLGANESQIIRVALRHPRPNQTIESDYRLIIKEVSVKKKQEKNTIAILMNYNLPVYVVPSELVGQSNWRLQKVNPQTVKLTLQNNSNMHANFSDINFHSTSNSKPALAKSLAINLLPGQQKTWTLPINYPLNSSTANLTATSDGKKINNIVTLN